MRRCAPHSPPEPRGPTSAGSRAGRAGRPPNGGPPVAEKATGPPDRARNPRRGSGPCSSSTSTASRWRRCPGGSPAVPRHVGGRRPAGSARRHGAASVAGATGRPVRPRVTQRLLAALAPTQSQGSGCGRLLAPDGRYEHAPLTMLTLPAADIDLLCATAAALGHPGLDADIAELVDAHAEQLGGGYRRPGRTDLVSLLARLAGLLDLAPTDDTRFLTAQLRATPPGTECVLSDAEEAAHARTADRMNHMWAHGSGIDRYLY